jgi:hypothetical protein
MSLVGVCIHKTKRNYTNHWILLMFVFWHLFLVVQSKNPCSGKDNLLVPMDGIGVLPYEIIPSLAYRTLVTCLEHECCHSTGLWSKIIDSQRDVSDELSEKHKAILTQLYRNATCCVYCPTLYGPMKYEEITSLVEREVIAYRTFRACMGKDVGNCCSDAKIMQIIKEYPAFFRFSEMLTILLQEDTSLTEDTSRVVKLNKTLP